MQKLKYGDPYTPFELVIRHSIWIIVALSSVWGVCIWFFMHAVCGSIENQLRGREPLCHLNNLTGVAELVTGGIIAVLLWYIADDIEKEMLRHLIRLLIISYLFVARPFLLMVLAALTGSPAGALYG